MKTLFTIICTFILLAIIGATYYFILPIVFIVGLGSMFVYFIILFMNTETPDDEDIHDGR